MHVCLCTDVRSEWFVHACRAIAYFALSVIQSAAEQWGGFHNRYAPYGFHDVGPVLQLENSTDFSITDNDLYGLRHVIVMDNCSHGLLARNYFYGGQAPGLVNVDHLACEHNHMASSWEGASWYFKYGWHIYHAHNTERYNLYHCDPNALPTDIVGAF